MITIISMVLVIVGALNWLSVGIFDFNFISWVFNGNIYFIARIIYCLVGLCGLWLIAYLSVNKFNSKNVGAIEDKYMYKDSTRQ